MERRSRRVEIQGDAEGQTAIYRAFRRGRAGFTAPIDFKCDYAPAGVKVPPAETIPEDRSEALLRISAGEDAKLGTGPLFIIGTTRNEPEAYLGTGETRVSSQVIKLTIAEPFVALVAEPGSVRRGGSAPYRWDVTPKGPFEGEAEVRLLGLPRGVSIRDPLPRITAASREVVFQLQATDEALLGTYGGIECELTIRASGQEIRQRTGKGSLRIDPKL